MSFFGRGSFTELGVYSWQSGVTEVIADETSPIPGGIGTFDSILPRGEVDAGLLFVGSNAITPNALYLWDGLALQRLLGSSTVRPRGGVGFDGFIDTAGFSQRLALVLSDASDQSTLGVYVYENGQLTLVADRTFVAPGMLGESFYAFADVDVDAMSVAFHAMLGLGTNKGIYRYTVGLPELVADTQTLVPGTNTVFADFANTVTVSDGRIAFVGRYTLSGQPKESIFLWDRGEIYLLLDDSVLAPETGEAFTRFSALDLDDGGSLLFVGRTATTGGIYRLAEGQLSQVLQVGDVVNGRTVIGFSFSSDGSRIAMRIQSAVSAQSPIVNGIYVESLPAAVPLGRLGIVLTLLLTALGGAIVLRDLGTG